MALYKHLCVWVVPSCFPWTIFVHCCVSFIRIYSINCVFLQFGCGSTRKLVAGRVTDITSVVEKLSNVLSWYFDCPKHCCVWRESTSRFQWRSMPCTSMTLWHSVPTPLVFRMRFSKHLSKIKPPERGNGTCFLTPKSQQNYWFNITPFRQRKPSKSIVFFFYQQHVSINIV